MTWKAPDVRLRYFFKDNLAARVTLGYTSTSEEDYDVSASSIGLGVEYHLAGNDKMSPYFAGGLAFGSGSETTTILDETFTSKGSSLSFGIVAGLDYYVTENLYLGLEIGLVKYASATSGEGAEKETTSGINLGGGSSIRMGWRF